jgi:hypothetical protein
VSYSVADWCSIAGLPASVASFGYAVYQQRRADREASKRKNLAAEAQRFLVGLKPSIDDERIVKAIDDQLLRLKSSL